MRDDGKKMNETKDDLQACYHHDDTMHPSSPVLLRIISHNGHQLAYNYRLRSALQLSCVSESIPPPLVKELRQKLSNHRPPVTIGPFISPEEEL